MKKRILVLILILLVLAQFKRIDKTNPSTTPEQDFFSVVNAPDAIQVQIRTSCYDCHSHETNYPWYSTIAPLSLWLADHVEEGRSHVNFSTWGALNEEKRAHTLEACAEVLEEKEMPMLPYMIAHRKAWIDDEQRAELSAFFTSLE